MNHDHRKILQAMFAHPVNANLNFQDIAEAASQELPRRIYDSAVLGAVSLP
jgi:hypothetical protein